MADANDQQAAEPQPAGGATSTETQPVSAASSGDVGGTASVGETSWQRAVRHTLLCRGLIADDD